MISPLAKRIPLPPNAITLLGLFFGLLAMFYLAQENRFLSLLFLILMGSCDLLDGAVAKASRRSTLFGAVLDSTVDRLTEGLVFFGILCAYDNRRDGLGMTLAFGALVASYLVSYSRARGENVIDACRVGFWERPERLCCLMLGVLVGRLKTVLWLLVIGSSLTSLHRLFHVRATLQKKRLPQTGLWSLLFWPYHRFSSPYVLYATTVILLLFLIQ